jgi:hypothetical protein
MAKESVMNQHPASIDSEEAELEITVVETFTFYNTDVYLKAW